MPLQNATSQWLLNFSIYFSATRDQLFIKQIVGILSKAHEKMKLNYERIVGSVVANKCRMGVLDSWIKEIRSQEMVPVSTRDKYRSWNIAKRKEVGMYLNEMSLLTGGGLQKLVE